MMYPTVHPSGVPKTERTPWTGGVGPLGHTSGIGTRPTTHHHASSAPPFLGGSFPASGMSSLKTSSSPTADAGCAVR